MLKRLTNRTRGIITGHFSRKPACNPAVLTKKGHPRGLPFFAYLCPADLPLRCLQRLPDIGDDVIDILKPYGEADKIR